ncbi:MAG TPA: nitroreductase/quinone reductase family protein, partial [Aggregatilineales bacterium]|nr:nitroreductase/quinone reductase family protein [Aggregatilineales bacterium]
EIWFVEHDGCYYLVSEGRERAHWVQNIQHHPQISIRVDGITRPGIGRTVDESDAAESELIRAVSAKMQLKYGWSTGLIVELKPEGESS